jgi:hypothetical protein
MKISSETESNDDSNKNYYCFIFIKSHKYTEV